MTDKSPEQIWLVALGELEVQVARANYETWLRDTRGLALADGSFTVGAPSAFATAWLEKRLAPLVKKTLSKVLTHEVEVVFEVTRPPSDPLPDLELRKAALEPVGRTNKWPGYGYEGTPLNPKYAFSTFIVGSTNRFAHAASVAVADGPGHSYNPLFLYGGVGLGKTHLLHAIGQKAVADGLRVLYITSEQFTNEFINALRERKTEDFRGKYRSVDVLLIDDIHFIADKEQTQESFFHTFNDLHNANRQIVISSDRSPRSMPLLEDRLRSRFEWGLIADIQAPELETRLAILQSKSAELRVEVPRDVLDFIAHRFQSNIRELEGALNRVIAYCHLAEETPSLDLAEAALAEMLFKPRDWCPTPNRVIETVARYFHLTGDDLVGPRRSKEIAFARHVAMHLLRAETQLSLADIGHEFGGRDHSTVLHGCERVANAAEESSTTRRVLMEVAAAVRSPEARV